MALLQGKVEWGKFLKGSARALLGCAEEKISQEHKSAVESATHFLLEILADREISVNKIKEEAALAGLSKASVRRAQEKLQIKPKLKGDNWYWQLNHFKLGS